MKLLSDGTFVSGSKDNSLYKWNKNGDLVRVVSEVEPIHVDAPSQEWITAIEIINDEYWVSGKINGRISLWNTAGDYVKDLLSRLPKTPHVSNPYNKYRIICLASGINKQKPGFFIGFPTMFNEFNVIEGKTVSSTNVHCNDWVYCIHPLTEKHILTVIGGNLEVFEKTNKEWKSTITLVQEEKFEKPRYRKSTVEKIKRQRPFISCLTPLESFPHLFGMGLFGDDDAPVKIIDIEKEKIVREWTEHKRRIWALENISNGIFASSAEDRTVKIWDARSSSNKSMITLSNHPGQVTSLLRLDDSTLVAGSCPEKPEESNEGAQLIFYDIRR